MGTSINTLLKIATLQRPVTKGNITLDDDYILEQLPMPKPVQLFVLLKASTKTG
jgi:hypothetical protein